MESSRQVALEEGESYATSLGIDHFSASAKTGKNINEIFKRMTERKCKKFDILLGIVVAGGNKKAASKMNQRGMFNAAAFEDDMNSRPSTFNLGQKQKAAKKGGCKC